MSKALFRFLRGELNGFYLTQLNATMNVVTEDIKTLLYRLYKLKFLPNVMDDETIYNIGKFAGVFLPRLASSEGYGTFRMSEDAIIAGQQRSERGLFEKASESFKFMYAEDESVDINTHATEELRSSLIGNDDSLEGYLDSREQNIITDDGEIDPTKVLPPQNPPEGVAYSDFYGSKFLFLADPIIITHNIDVELFYPLYKAMQYVRYNGANIYSICKIIEGVCPKGMVRILDIHKHPLYPCIEVDYKFTDIEIDFKTQRIATMLYVMRLKFPQVVMTEVIE